MPRKCEDHTLEDQRRELDKIEEIRLEQILEHLERARTKGAGNSKQGSNLGGTSKEVEQRTGGEDGSSAGKRRRWLAGGAGAERAWRGRGGAVR